MDPHQQVKLTAKVGLQHKKNPFPEGKGFPDLDKPLGI
jgi:hypothetical protein